MDAENDKEFENNIPMIKTEILAPTLYSHIINDFSILDQSRDIIDYDIVREHFLNQGRLSKKQANKILVDSTKIFKEEENVIRLDTNVHILGDIHGNFYSLINMISNIDLNKDTVVFLGNYINRGDFSTEVYLYLSLLKVHFPKNIIMLRGSHESKTMAENFGFRNECYDKYNNVTYKLFLESFASLPIACIVNESLFCIHGGLSPDVKTIEDIQKINRFQETVVDGPFLDILWSDPHPLLDSGMELDDFIYNNNRCCSWYYNLKATRDFLNENELLTIVRGHEIHENGYKVYEIDDHTKSIVSLFSAPDFCDMYMNKGCVLFYNGHDLKFNLYEGAKKPFKLKNGLDGINLTFPFLSQKVAEFYFELLKFVDSKYDNESDAKRVLIETEMKKVNVFITANTLVRIERENLTEFEDSDNRSVSNYIKISPTRLDFESTKSMDECNQILCMKDLKQNGISLKKIPSLKPNLISNSDETNFEALFNRSELVFVEKSSVVTIKNIVTSSSGGVFGWCVR